VLYCVTATTIHSQSIGCYKTKM